MISKLVLIFSAIVTYVLGKISKKFGWNENLPIPIQNALVGIIVFTLIYLYLQIIGLDENPEELIEIIFSSLGGSGIATLGYDMKNK